MQELNVGDNVEVVGTGIKGEIVLHDFINDYIQTGVKGMPSASQDEKIKKPGKKLAICSDGQMLMIDCFSSFAQIKKI